MKIWKTKEMNPMSNCLPFTIRTAQVYAKNLLLVGYSPFVIKRFELHPQFTVLIGTNGSGKTTLLDAIQTILICDQNYLHFNVASGQSSRDLSGQLIYDAAWAVLEIDQHRSIKAIGIHLEKQHNSSDNRVKITPFVLDGLSPENNLFFDEKTREVTRDIPALINRVIQKNLGLGTEVKSCDSFRQYHEALYAEGILPINLATPNALKSFSLLWRQMTMPNEQNLKSLLKGVLCHAPNNRSISFTEAAELCRERQRASRDLTRLKELREAKDEIESLKNELDENRRVYLAGQLWDIRNAGQRLEREFRTRQTQLAELEQQQNTLQKEIEEKEIQRNQLEVEREKSFQAQNSLEKKRQHFEQYQTATKTIETLSPECERLEAEIKNSQDQLAENEQQKEILGEKVNLLRVEIGELKQQGKNLQEQAEKWGKLHADIVRAAKELDITVNRVSIQREYREASEAKSRIEQLGPMKKQLKLCEVEVESVEKARAKTKKMISLWPDFFDEKIIDETLTEQALAQLDSEKEKFQNKEKDLQQKYKQIHELINNLCRKQLALPESASRLVQAGKAVQFASRYEDLDETEAAAKQLEIAPLLEAIEPRNREDLATLAAGDEGFLVVLPEHGNSLDNIEVLTESEEGVIAGNRGIAWYSPRKREVLLGTKAREARLKEAKAELERLDGQLRNAQREIQINTSRRLAIHDFLPHVHAFGITDAESRLAKLQKEIAILEEEAPKINNRYTLITEIYQKKDCFDYEQAPAKLESLQKKIEESEKKQEELVRQLSTAKAAKTLLEKALLRLQEETIKVREQIQNARVICQLLEQEELREVLEGKIDFGEAEELARKIQELRDAIKAASLAIETRHRVSGEVHSRIEETHKAILKSEEKQEKNGQALKGAQAEWAAFYPDKDCEYHPVQEEEKLENYRNEWKRSETELKSKLKNFGKKYELTYDGKDPEKDASLLLQRALPRGASLEQIENNCEEKLSVLSEIETKIRDHILNFCQFIKSDIKTIERRIRQANTILGKLQFGNIQQIEIQSRKLATYKALEKFQGPQLNFFNYRDGITSVKEFSATLIETIRKEVGGEPLTEEMLTDYRTYIDIGYTCRDTRGNLRSHSFSSGEMLGVNMGLSFAMLDFMRNARDAKQPGLNLFCIDEGLRLDANAISAIKELLGETYFQMVIAAPYPFDIPDVITHFCVPQEGGVCSVTTYRGVESPKEEVAAASTTTI